MKLYDIQDAILNLVDDETGEVTNVEMFEQLQMEEDEKIENIALWIKSLDAEAKAIRDEEKSLAERRAVKEKKAQSLKDFLAKYLDGRKVETPRMKIGWRKSEKVVIENEEMIPEMYTKLVKSIDRTELKKALKEGIEIEGARIEHNNNIQIK